MKLLEQFDSATAQDNTIAGLQKLFCCFSSNSGTCPDDYTVFQFLKLHIAVYPVASETYPLSQTNSVLPIPVVIPTSPCR